MWEDAAPMQEREPPRPPARPRSEEDLVLWAQILLCLAAVGFVLAAKLLGWPAYPVLRRAFAAATQPEQSLLLGEERGLLKFTEQTAEELANSARSMWDDFTAAPETARTPHGQPTPPAYASEDSYTPDFALCFPLPGHFARKTSGYGWRTDPMGGLGDDFHIATTWQRPGARRYWPPQTAWCARRAAIKAMATMSASCTPTATRRCTHICNTCLSARGSA